MGNKSEKGVLSLLAGGGRANIIRVLPRDDDACRAAE
jgi:hypothetical protein